MGLPATLIEGDGIGPEVVGAAVEAIAAAGARIDWQPASAGAAAVASQGVPLPRETLESIRRTRLALKGPLETPIAEGWRSVSVALRKELDLYASVRPVHSFEGVETRWRGVDLVVIRENTQGMYSGIEHFVDEQRSAAESISIITRKGSERLAEYAFDYARRHGRKRIALVHKANILKCTSGLFLEAGRTVALRHPEIEFREIIVDHCAMQLVRDPTQFDLLVTTNLFGDIIGDLCAGLVGGLGLTASANIGQAAAIFEAAHGTAPRLAGKGIANPSATMLSGALLLEHAGEREAAARLTAAVRGAIAARESLTPDLGGSGTTREFTAAVLRRLSSGTATATGS